MTVDVQIAGLEADLIAAWNEIEDIRILTTYRPFEFEQSTEAEKAIVLALFGADPHEHLIPGLGVTR